MTKNAIISVFNLIVLYILVAFYLIYIGITFLGISYIVVYIGAIAILFLFIIMMIDIEIIEKRSSNYLPLLFFLLSGFFFLLRNILYYVGLIKIKSFSFKEQLIYSNDKSYSHNLENIVDFKIYSDKFFVFFKNYGFSFNKEEVFIHNKSVLNIILEKYDTLLKKIFFFSKEFDSNDFKLLNKNEENIKNFYDFFSNVEVNNYLSLVKSNIDDNSEKYLEYTEIDDLFSNNYLLIFPDWNSAVNRVTQISAIGDVFYTVYHSYIYILSVLLLLAMIGAIVLTADYTRDIKIVNLLKPLNKSINKISSESIKNKNIIPNKSLSFLVISNVNFEYLEFFMIFFIIFLLIYFLNLYYNNRIKYKENKRNLNDYLIIRGGIFNLTNSFLFTHQKICLMINKLRLIDKEEPIYLYNVYNNESFEKMVYYINHLFFKDEINKKLNIPIHYWVISQEEFNKAFDILVTSYVLKTYRGKCKLAIVVINEYGIVKRIYEYIYYYPIKKAIFYINEKNEILDKKGNSIEELLNIYPENKKKIYNLNNEKIKIVSYLNLKIKYIYNKYKYEYILKKKENIVKYEEESRKIIMFNNNKRFAFIPSFDLILNMYLSHSEDIKGSLFYFLVVCFIIAALLLFINSYFSLSNKYLEKEGGFECGFTSFFQTRERFNIIFYRVSLLFLIFDLEIILIFPFPAMNWRIQDISKNNVLIFLYILVIGFIYELKEGALNIVKKAYSFYKDNISY